MTGRVVLLRHGVTSANENCLYCGATDLPLSERGRAELLEKRMHGGYPNSSGFRVVTSGMLRAEQTLELLFGQIAHERVPGLREVNFGSFEMYSYEELKDQKAYQLWLQGDNEKNIPPDGESGQMMCERVTAAFQELLEGGQELLIIAHGGPIAALMAWLFPACSRTRYEWQPRGGEGYTVLFEAGRPVSWTETPACGG